MGRCIRLPLLLLIAALFVVCAPASQAKVLICGVSVTSDAGSRPPHNITYMIAGLPATTPVSTATVSIVVKDSANNLVATITRGDPPAASWVVPAGVYLDQWDGSQDSDGRQAPEGNYTFEITATAAVSATNWEMIWDGPDSIYYGDPAVNRNRNSPYYGWIYFPRQSDLKVHAYNPLGVEVASAGGMGTGSVPFGMAVGDDDTVYVQRRSTPQQLFRFNPDLTGMVDLTACNTALRKYWGGSIRVTGAGIDTRFYLNDNYSTARVYKAASVDTSGRPDCVAEDTGSPLAPVYSLMGAIAGNPGNTLSGSPAYGQIYFGQDLNTAGVVPRMWEWNGAAWTESGTWPASALARSVGIDFLPTRTSDTPPRASQLIVSRLAGSGTVLYTYSAQGGGIADQWTVSNTPTGATYFINRIATDAVGNLAVTCKSSGTPYYRGNDAQYWAAPDPAGTSTDNLSSLPFWHGHCCGDPPPIFKATSATPDTVPADGISTTTLKALVQDRTNNGTPWDVASVTVDLTAIGGSPTAAMMDGGVPGTDPTIHVYTLVTSMAVGSCPGSYNLVVTASDTAKPPDPVNVSTYTIPLHVTAEVAQGYVISGLSGGAIEGAEVRVTECTGITTAATSGADGSFVINVPQGACTLSVTAGGWNTGAGSTQTVIVPAGGLVLAEPLKLYPKNIQQAQNSALLSPVGVTGTVTSVAADPANGIYGIEDAGEAGKWLVFIQDDSGSPRGIPLRGDFTPGQIVEGDQVECRGILRRLVWDNVLAVDVPNPGDNWITKIPGMPAPITPEEVTVSQITTSEDMQGRLVRLNGVVVDTVPACCYLRAWDGACGTTNWGTSEQLYWYLGMRVRDATGTGYVYVVVECDNTSLGTVWTGLPCDSLPPVGTTIDVIGIVHRYLSIPLLAIRKPSDLIVGYVPGFCAGWDMISVPLEPSGSKRPEDIFFIVELGRTLDPSELSASALNRYSDSDKSYVPYDEFDPATFGDIRPRDGYWFNYYQAMPYTLRYNGQPRTGDVDFELKYAGWNIVGYGQMLRQPLENTFIVNLTTGEVETFRNAWYLRGWISGPLQTWDCWNLTYATTGVDCPAFEWNASVVESWRGYWFNSNVPDLLWRIPIPSGEPGCEP